MPIDMFAANLLQMAKLMEVHPLQESFYSQHAMLHTWTEVRLNPTWVYLKSKDVMRAPYVRASKRAPTWYVCRLASISLNGQPLDQVWVQSGPKGMLVLAHRHMERGLISKLLKRAFSWHPWIPGTLKLDSIWFLFKCEYWLRRFSPKRTVFTQSSEPLIFNRTNIANIISTRRVGKGVLCPIFSGLSLVTVTS